MTDVLLIGSGIAGLTTALEAKRLGLNVTVVNKAYATRAQSSMAQGGINACMGYDTEDSVSKHIEDTLKSSAGLANKQEVSYLCQEAKEAILWLDKMGVAFSRDPQGRIAQRRLGGTKHERACYAQDYTGLKILHTLYDKALHSGVKFIHEYFLLDIVKEHDRAVGATFLDIKTTQVHTIYAKAVVLATGGYSRIFHTFSTNSTASSGDGMAVALQAGAALSDMEFVQFHPTGLAKSSVLISESARGIGGYVLNAQKKRFTDELAPRDVVARAIFKELEEGGVVYLDLRHIGKERIDKELPQERKLALLYEGVDISKELVPIRPVAHYSMGGIAVDEQCMTCVEGLFAVGECANHNVHGANRLGGNSLLEVVTFGKKCAQSVETFSKHKSMPDIKQDREKSDVVEALFEQESIKVDFYKAYEQMGKSAYKHLGLFRSEAGLKEFLKLLDDLEVQVPLMGIEDKSRVYNSNLLEFLEFKNMLSLAKISASLALERRESRGAHYRIDFDTPNEAYAKHSMARMTQKGIEVYYEL